jgi:hypothetical protein
MAVAESSTFVVDNFVDKRGASASSAMTDADFGCLLEFCAEKNLFKSMGYDNISVV